MEKKPVQIIVTTAPRHGNNPWGFATDIDKTLAKQLWGWAALTNIRLDFSVDEERRGTMFTLRQGLSKALPGHDILWLEDDIKFCKNAVKAMVGATVPSTCGFLSFYDHRHFRQKIESPTLGMVAMSEGLYGLQAVRFPARAIECLKLHDSNDHLTFPSDSDLQVSTWLKTRYSHFAVCLPNLVQHIGHKSVRLRADGQPVDTHDWNGYSANYAGDDFDAMTLDLG